MKILERIKKLFSTPKTTMYSADGQARMRNLNDDEWIVEYKHQTTWFLYELDPLPYEEAKSILRRASKPTV